MTRKLFDASITHGAYVSIKSKLKGMTHLVTSAYLPLESSQLLSLLSKGMIVQYFQYLPVPLVVHLEGAAKVYVAYLTR